MPCVVPNIAADVVATVVIDVDGGAIIGIAGTTDDCIGVVAGIRLGIPWVVRGSLDVDCAAVNVVIGMAGTATRSEAGGEAIMSTLAPCGFAGSMFPRVGALLGMAGLSMRSAALGAIDAGSTAAAGVVDVDVGNGANACAGVDTT